MSAEGDTIRAAFAGHKSLLTREARLALARLERHAERDDDPERDRDSEVGARWGMAEDES